MKNMARGLLLLFVGFAVSIVHGGQPAPGVPGVDVQIRQNPAKRAVTGSQGSFAFEGLAPGSYTVAFRARKAKDLKNTPSDKVTVAESYSIKIEGTKAAVNQSGLTSNQLLAGLDIPVQVAAGGKIRGQVTAGGVKKMVWISQEPGSHIPGHWVEVGTPEAKRAFRSNALGMSGDGQRRLMENTGDNHQEGWRGPVVPPGGH
jgi:SdrD B-like domain